MQSQYQNFRLGLASGGHDPPAGRDADPAPRKASTASEDALDEERDQVGLLPGHKSADPFREMVVGAGQQRKEDAQVRALTIKKPASFLSPDDPDTLQPSKACVKM